MRKVKRVGVWPVGIVGGMRVEMPLVTDGKESEILKYFTTRDELEPLAENCTKVYVWHTRTQKPSIVNPQKLKRPLVSYDHIEV
ncbi:hypothetical protein HF086_010345 [Spodoptera exigua]|uniref:Galactosylgalactosylxylosylprotein 3-beta-glucuronosyltransferase n=1 Tax=Spodoptera exigua TaxID=7107 RepID=A0A922MN78_SPOEX|nr:hypothetical protein HF086_010345 [Spodoptera exigua]